MTSGFGIVSETPPRHAEHGSGPAASTHAVDGHAGALLEVRQHVARGGEHDLTLPLGIDRRVAAHEVLQPERADRAR